MSCYRPLQAWRGKLLESGKRSVVFKRTEAGQSLVDSELRLPCGQCIGCRLERSRQWAFRCVNEASLYKDNCFLTLTYDEKNLPGDGGLHVRDFQLFMKRLRKDAYERGRSSGIRFFHCGEYGETFGRPHFHACVFNLDFKDKVAFRVNSNGNMLYRSAALERLWPMGFSMIGDVTFESAAYVARYVMKKVTGEGAVEHYVNKASGEVLSPEYVTMSRRPGIGRAWYDKYKSDLFPSDQAVLRGKVMQPPKFYDRIYELTDPEEFVRIKCERNRRAAARSFDNGDIRLAVKEEVKMAEISNLRRSLEV